MSLFQCHVCGCIENTATVGRGYSNEPAACSVCEPCSITRWCAIKKDGSRYAIDEARDEWHNLFERVYLPLGMFVKDERGGLKHRETGEPPDKYERKKPWGLFGEDPGE